MHNKSLFDTAVKMIPADEQMEKQMVTFIDGNLYFFSSSRSSWFHIRSFMEGETQFNIPANVLSDILQIGDVIVAENIDVGRVRFKSGTANFDTGVMTEVQLPPISYPDDNFRNIHPIFHIGGNLLKMINDGTCRLNSLIIDDYTMAIIATVGAKYMGGIIYNNPDGIDRTQFVEGNFTNTFDIISMSALKGSKFNTATNMLYLKNDISSDISIMSCMRMNPPMVQNEVGEILNRFIISDNYKTLAHSEIKIPAKEYLEIIKIAGSMATDGSATFEVEPERLTIKVSDNYRRQYQKTIPCESPVSVKFMAYFLNQAQLVHILSCASETKKMDGKISMIVLPSLSRLIYMPVSRMEKYNSFIMTSMRIIR